MTEEERSKVFRDITFRLSKGVMVSNGTSVIDLNMSQDSINLLNRFKTGEIDLKPYLRSMGSMNEEEKAEYINLFEGMPWSPNPVELLEFLIDKGFDYRGLIEDGLALEL